MENAAFAVVFSRGELVNAEVYFLGSAPNNIKLRGTYIEQIFQETAEITLRLFLGGCNPWGYDASPP